MLHETLLYFVHLYLSPIIFLQDMLIVSTQNYHCVASQVLVQFFLSFFLMSLIQQRMVNKKIKLHTEMAAKTVTIQIRLTILHLIYIKPLPQMHITHGHQAENLNLAATVTRRPRFHRHSQPRPYRVGSLAAPGLSVFVNA